MRYQVGVDNRGLLLPDWVCWDNSEYLSPEVVSSANGSTYDGKVGDLYLSSQLGITAWFLTTAERQQGT